MKIEIRWPDGRKELAQLTPEQIPDVVSSMKYLGHQVADVDIQGDLTLIYIATSEAGLARASEGTKARVQEKLVASVLEDRGAQYGEAWLMGGKFLAEMMRKYDIDLSDLMESGFSYAWQSILSKLLRALASPMKRDHWVDIAGYATLVANYLGEDNEEAD